MRGESGGWCGGKKKMMKRRCDQCFRTLRLLHSLSETPPFVPGLFPLNPPTTSAILSSDRCYRTISEPLTLLARLLTRFFFFSLSLRVLLAGAQKPKLAYCTPKRKRGSVNTTVPPAENVGAPFFFFFLPEIKLTRLWSGLHLKKI